MKNIRRTSLISILLALMLLLSACGASSLEGEASTVYVLSMDTVIELTAYGPERESALTAAEAEIRCLNDLLSIGLEDSEISRLNREGITVIMVSHDISAAVRYASHILHIGDILFYGTKEEYLKSEAGKTFLLQQKGGDGHAG